MTQPSMAWQQRNVSITAEGPTSRILLDDQDVSQHVQGYTIEHRVGERPVVVLHALPSGSTVFEGLALVAIGQPADPASVIADFLSGLDPSQLQSAALNRTDLDGSATEITAAILKTLTDWAQGRI